jgi:ATP-dependent Zn protease
MIFIDELDAVEGIAAETSGLVGTDLLKPGERAALLAARKEAAAVQSAWTGC